MGKPPEAVNPTLDRQLARLRMRLAKTPLPRFFSWWGGQLLACLPERWRNLLSERSESLLLDLRDDRIIVWREKGDSVTEYGTIARSRPGDEQAAEFRRLRGGIDDTMVRTVFVIPSERVLTRTLTLPAAAEENLRQVLGFEMDRQTPFKADQVYFDSRVLGYDASGRNAHVELVLIPRGQLDEELATLPAGTADIDGVDTWNGAPGAGRRQTNLLPPERRARRRSLRVPVVIGLAALAVILLVVNMDQSLANRAAAVELMRGEVEKSAAEAKQVAALKKTLVDSIAGANFLTERKRSSALMVALMSDLTERIPTDTYLERLQIENKQVQLQGQAAEASKLIALLGASPCLGNPGFQGQVQPDARTGKDRFQINADLKECSPEAVAKASRPNPAQATAPKVAPGKNDATQADPVQADATKTDTIRSGDKIKGASKPVAVKSGEMGKAAATVPTPPVENTGPKQPAVAGPKPVDASAAPAAAASTSRANAAAARSARIKAERAKAGQLREPVQPAVQKGAAKGREDTDAKQKPVQAEAPHGKK